ncbi:hypothetical protein L873DRAFT_1350105 [Choiromyces venosus 120613-1]|uniref:Uncharacterized protein n=1 Tax=Choiromyces venosus 120613-1 TaxID=1336337 RepID=A0A3N4K276_9PEZI|nr:hypothetical protein L873DRAFT_1350105 [Choiromyces venosus 120613-1]
MLGRKATKGKAQIRLQAKNKATQPGRKLAVRHPSSLSQAWDASQPALQRKRRMCIHLVHACSGDCTPLVWSWLGYGV